MKRLISQLFVLIGLSLMVASCQKAPFVTLNTPRSLTFTRDGGTQNITFTCNRDWSVSSSESWIQVSPSTGTARDGEVTVKITCAANTTYDPRYATVTVKAEELSETISISQDTGLGLLVSPKTIDLTNAAQDITIEVTNNVIYRVIIPDDAKEWITLKTDTQTKALSTDIVVLTVARNNTYDQRETSITLKQEDGALSETVKIIQAQSDTIVVSPTEINLPYSGGKSSILVEANVDISASVQGNPYWLTVSKDPQTKSLQQQSYTILAAENNGDDRDAYILFSGSGQEQRVHVVQSGFPLIVSASTLVADCLDGATLTIQVKAAGSWTVTEKGSSILSLSKNNGDAGSSSLTISFNGANCTNTNRIANLEFQCEGLYITVQLSQVPAFRFDSLDHTLPSSGGSYKFYFHIPRPFQSGTVRTHDYDNGFYRLLYYEGEDNAPNGVSVGEASSDANPVDTYMWMMYNFKANYGKNARTGRFRLAFTENGQTLLSEWINVTQLGDPTAGDEADGIVSVLQQHSRGAGVPLVILGDGFTKSDIEDGAFANAARQAYNYFFSVEPVTSLREYFDVWSITAVSLSSSFDGSTRFGGMFRGGTRIDGKDDLAIRYASKVVPSNKTNDMLIIIVMNSTRYAGTCYLHYVDYGSYRVLACSVAYVPMSQQSGMTFEDVIHHEACGHGLGKLADEYTGYGAISASEANDLEVFQRAGAYVNVDLHSNVESTSWADYAADSRFGYESISAYEGGYTYNTGVYRPTQTSIMVSNKGIFNAPSRAQIYKRVMGIANNWNWTFDYEDFVSFDAPFRRNNYNSSSTTSVRQNYAERNDLVPLAPPVLVKDN